MFWSFVTASQDMLWHMWLWIRWQKLLLNFCGKGTSWSLEHWPSSWVTEELILRATSSVSCVSSWAFGRSRTLPYHPQTNGQVEWAHQMLMQMIGKLGRDQKADWPKHLPELVHAYNSMRLAITRYSPHYLMFGQWPCTYLSTFIFLTIVSTEKHHHVDHYIADLHEWLCEALKEAQVHSPHLRLKGRGNTMIVKLMPFHWNQVT